MHWQTEVGRQQPVGVPAGVSLGHFARFEARQAAPEDPLVQLLSAEVSIHTQDYARARPLLEKVIRELPENIRAHVLLSQVYIHLQQVDEAKREEAIAKALQESAEKQREQTMQTPAGKPTPP